MDQVLLRGNPTLMIKLWPLIGSILPITNILFTVDSSVYSIGLAIVYTVSHTNNMASYLRTIEFNENCFSRHEIKHCSDSNTNISQRLLFLVLYLIDIVITYGGSIILKIYILKIIIEATKIWVTY